MPKFFFLFGWFYEYNGKNNITLASNMIQFNPLPDGLVIRDLL